MISASPYQTIEQKTHFFQNPSKKSLFGDENNILFVDDDCNVLDRLSKSFAICARHYNTFTARNGKEAIEVLQSFPVKILLTALHMPVMNGFSLMNYTKIYYPATRTFVMSADEPSTIINKLTAAGIDGYIKKPFAIETIYSILRL